MPIEVGLEQLILHDPVYFELALSKGLGDFLADLPVIGEDLPFVELE